eukprot:gene37895-46761_t
MGHFLLTNSLLPMMKDGRVVNIASTYHFQADGSTLQPPVDATSDDTTTTKADNSRALLALTFPSAARHENTTFRHRRIAYGVSKLAQVLHAKELQRRLDSDTFSVTPVSNNDTASSENSTTTTTPSPTKGPQNVKVVSVCPGWVGTNILPNNPSGNFIRNNAFTTRASILCAMLDTSLQGGEFVVNYQIPLTQHESSPLMFRIATFLGIRDIFSDIIALIALTQQSKTYGCHVQKSSAESNDEVLAKSLYDWTLNELTSNGY